jgi:hypothetical protein
MDAIGGWIMIAAVLWLSWPGFRTPSRRALLVFLVLLFPVVSWIYTITVGVKARRSACADRKFQQVRADLVRRAHDIQFWRLQLRHGTGAEQDLARQMLDILTTPPN